MTTVLVVGCGGLLGSALVAAHRRRGADVVPPAVPLSWCDAAALHDGLAAVVAAFAAAVPPHDDWEIDWAAGVGTMGSAEADLRVETDALAALLDAVRRSAPLDGRRGRVVLSSSAGAIYAGCREPVVTERVPDCPTTPYARHKLAQERLVANFAASTGARALLARLSTLYGVRQSIDKPQGLLTHIARCVVANRPVGIFVPLDTLRDYVAADDAASAMLAADGAAAPGRAVVKIFASEQPTSIAEILSTFRRVAGRPPRIVTTSSRDTGLYGSKSRLTSVVEPRRPYRYRSLAVGIAQLVQAERLRHGAPRPAARP